MRYGSRNFLFGGAQKETGGIPVQNAGTAVSASTTLQWNLIANIARLLDASWNLASSVGQQSGLRWDMLHPQAALWMQAGIYAS